MAGALAASCTPRQLDVVDPCTDASPPSASCPAQPPPPNPLLQGLVGWWPLDDGAGSGLAVDRTDNGNDGTLVDLDPATAWVPGRWSSALEIGGLGYVQVPRRTDWSVDAITTQVTVSAWIYFEGSIRPADMWGTALSREIGTTNRQHYHISLNSAEVPSMFILDARMQGLEVAPRFKWTHLAGTYDGARMRLYVDGVLVQEQATAVTFPADTTPLLLGANGNGPGMGVTERFPGRIDELMLWNRALSADEIARVAAGPPY